MSKSKLQMIEDKYRRKREKNVVEREREREREIINDGVGRI